MLLYSTLNEKVQFIFDKIVVFGSVDMGLRHFGVLGAVVCIAKRSIVDQISTSKKMDKEPHKRLAHLSLPKIFFCALKSHPRLF
jgi:hypothetical protein